jgi:protein-tyrosine phosphatase
LIDTHCHLLWRIDDGPRTAMESVDLARTLVSQGVQAVLCTPHYSPRFPTGVEAARSRFDELRRDLDELEIELRTALAAEIHFVLALSVPVDELRARSAGGFVLVELDPEASADIPTRVAERVAGSGLVPIFAHPERSAAVRDDPAALDEARRGGALVQVVASSLAARRGAAAADGAWALLDAGRADLLASDAHGARGTASRLRQILDQTAERYGAHAVDELTARNPAKVFGG